MFWKISLTDMNYIDLLLLMSYSHLSYALESYSITKTNKDKNYKPGELIFSDEFDHFDLETWSHEITFSGNSHWEFQMYTNSRKTSFIRNGHLHFKPKMSTEEFGDLVYNWGRNGDPVNIDGSTPVDKCTYNDFLGCERKGSPDYLLNPVMSARIRTVYSFYFRYGRVEVRAKLPSGDWLWPAIWMMPRFNQYGGWPASGEVDIMESRGNKIVRDEYGKPHGCNTVSHSVHFGPKNDKDGFLQFLTTVQNDSFADEFHLFGLEWTDEKMVFKVDNVVTLVVDPPDSFWESGWFDKSDPNPWRYSKNKKMAPFDQKFYLILNLAVGGMNNYFPDHWYYGEGDKKKPWGNTEDKTYRKFMDAKDRWFPTWEGDKSSFIIDYIRVYAI